MFIPSIDHGSEAWTSQRAMAPLRVLSPSSLAEAVRNAEPLSAFVFRFEGQKTEQGFKFHEKYKGRCPLLMTGEQVRLFNTFFAFLSEQEQQDISKFLQFAEDMPQQRMFVRDAFQGMLKTALKQFSQEQVEQKKNNEEGGKPVFSFQNPPILPGGDSLSEPEEVMVEQTQEEAA